MQSMTVAGKSALVYKAVHFLINEVCFVKHPVAHVLKQVRLCIPFILSSSHPFPSRRVESFACFEDSFIHLKIFEYYPKICHNGKFSQDITAHSCVHVCELSGHCAPAHKMFLNGCMLSFVRLSCSVWLNYSDWFVNHAIPIDDTHSMKQLLYVDTHHVMQDFSVFLYF